MNTSDLDNFQLNLGYQSFHYPTNAHNVKNVERPNDIYICRTAARTPDATF